MAEVIKKDAKTASKPAEKAAENQSKADSVAAAS